MQCKIFARWSCRKNIFNQPLCFFSISEMMKFSSPRHRWTSNHFVDHLVSSIIRAGVFTHVLYMFEFDNMTSIHVKLAVKHRCKWVELVHNFVATYKISFFVHKKEMQILQLYVVILWDAVRCGETSLNANIVDNIDHAWKICLFLVTNRWFSHQKTTSKNV